MFEQKLPLKNLTKQEKLNTDKFDLTLINEGLFDVTFVKAPRTVSCILFIQACEVDHSEAQQVEWRRQMPDQLIDLQ